MFFVLVMALALLIGAGALLAVMIVRFVQARNSGRTDGAWVSSPMVLGIAGGVLGLGITAMVAVNALELPLWIFSLMGVAGGITGIVGGAIVKRHRKAASVLMLAGAALSLITIFGPMLLICGGVLALLPVKAADDKGLPIMSGSSDA